jgi:ribose transport system ATP-binding protein
MKKEIARMEYITKYFFGTRALLNARMNLYEGEILGITGLNWCGKTTLVKILAGFFPADKGLIFLDDEQVKLNLSNDAIKFGIYYIGQDSPLVSKMTITENICLANKRRKHGILIKKDVEFNQVARLLEEFNIGLNPNETVESLLVDQKNLIHICAALANNAKIIILDDITGTYSKEAIERLITVLSKIRERCISIIYVSNRLDDVFFVADRTMILKDGQNLWTLRKEEYSRERVQKILAGNEFSIKFKKTYPHLACEVLRVCHLNLKDKFYDVNFYLKTGEILGFAINNESIRNKLGETLFGLNTDIEGEIYIRGKKVKLKNAKIAIRSGIGFVPEQVYRKGLFNNMGLLKNINLLFPRKLSNKFQIIDPNMEKYVSTLNLEKIGLSKAICDIDELSNLDKLKLSIQRCLVLNPKIMVFVNPTLGLDMVVKDEIYLMINNMARQGIGVILISSDLHELVELSDRIIIFGKEEVIGEYDKNDISKMEILKEKILNSFIVKQN